MECKINVEIKNPKVVKMFVGALVKENLAHIGEDKKVVWNDEVDTPVKVEKEENGYRIESPLFEIDKEDVYDNIVSFLQEYEPTGVYGKVTLIEYKEKSKKIKSYNFDEGREKEFSKPLSRQDLAKRYEKEIEKSINELAEKLNGNEVDEIYKSLLQTGLSMYNYSMKNVYWVAMQAKARGRFIDSIASFKKWTSLKEEGKLLLSQDDKENIVICLSLKNGKEFELKINDERKKMWFNAEECDYEAFTQESELQFVDEDKALSKKFEPIANLMYKNALKMQKSGENEKKISVSPSIIKGEKGYSIFVPIVKTIEEEVPVYEKDENGEIVRDINGQPVQKYDKEGNPVYEIIKRKILTGFTLGSVFDVNQTNAKELGLYVSPNEKFMSMLQHKIKIDDEIYNEVAQKIQEIYDIPVNAVKNVGGGMGGYYTPTEHAIYINEDICDTNEKKLSVLFHELGHALMHSFKSQKEYDDAHKKSTTQKEIEAESFSYILSSKFGINAHSEVYIHSFLKNVDKANREKLFFSLMDNVRKNAIKVENELNIGEIVEKALEKNQKLYNEKVKKVENIATYNNF